MRLDGSEYRGKRSAQRVADKDRRLPMLACNPVESYSE
jgi:hypothetical protein